MENLNVQIKLDNSIITSINYEFEENAMIILIKEIEKKHLTDDDIADDLTTTIENETTVKISLRNDFRQCLVVMDSHIKEYAYSKSLKEKFEDLKDGIVFKDLEISVKFMFNLEIISKINDEDSDIVKKQLIKKIEEDHIETCKNEVLQMVKSITSLDSMGNIDFDSSE